MWAAHKEEYMASAQLFVLHNANAGQDERLNEWYNGVHAIEALKAVEGMTSAARYRFSTVEVLPGTGVDSHRYLTVYELEGDTDEALERVAESLRQFFFGGAAPSADELDGSDSNPLDPSLDLTTMKVGFAIPVMSRVTREEAIAGNNAR